MIAAAQTRFWAKVIPEPNTGCWLWLGGTSHGYGAFWLAGRQHRAHRLAWEWSAGRTVPTGLVVCHVCDQPSCVNPSHLFVATPTENNRDRDQKGRTATGAKCLQQRPALGERNGARMYPERLSRGPAVNTCKLTEADVRALRERYAHGEPVRSIARSVAMHRTSIRALVLRRTWRHVQ